MTCARCGTLKNTSGSACSSCGSLDQSVISAMDGVQGRAEVGNVGRVAEERDASGEQFRVRGQTPAGARSDEMLADGVVSINIHGPIQIGRKGEPRALDTLLSRLRQDGHQPVLEAGRDQRGEDGILLLQGERLTLQVVSVPSCSKQKSEVRAAIAAPKLRSPLSFDTFGSKAVTRAPWLSYPATRRARQCGG